MTVRGARGPEAGPTVFLSAGESSGDLHAARLAEELRRRRPELRLVGLGGSRMRSAGVELLADLDLLAVMGVAEVVRSLPSLLRLQHRVRRFLLEEEVDLLVPVDYPGFNLPLACHAHDHAISVLYYVAPQVWAWRSSRARKLARCTDRVCAVLPFEEAFLADYGADVRFVGHPLLDDRSREDRDGERREKPKAGPVLGLFPGSRAQEVDRMLELFLATSDRLRGRRPELSVWIAGAPDLDRGRYPRDRVDRVAPPEEVLAASRVALTKSGTVTLQLALAGVPMVVAHQVNPLTFRLARWLVRVDHVALANLVAGRRLVPELLQDEASPGRLADEIEPLIEDGPARRAVLDGLRDVAERLGKPGCTRRVADDALRLLEAER